MPETYIDLTSENISSEHLCCIIRSKAKHPGIEAKRAWLTARLAEGHVFRKLNAKGCCFIEYAPLKTAWVPIEGDLFLYIYCLWADRPFKGQGHGKALLESCIADAKARGYSGVCMLGSKKQKNWLSNQEFAKKNGFITVDTTASGYELLCLSFDGSAPHFTDSAKLEHIDDPAFTVYYSDQCPFIPQKIAVLEKYCAENGVPFHLIHVDSLEKAKALPCVFNNWASFYQGRFVSVNLTDPASLQKIVKR